MLVWMVRLVHSICVFSINDIISYNNNTNDSVIYDTLILS